MELVEGAHNSHAAGRREMTPWELTYIVIDTFLCVIDLIRKDIWLDHIFVNHLCT